MNCINSLNSLIFIDEGRGILEGELLGDYLGCSLRFYNKNSLKT